MKNTHTTTWGRRALAALLCLAMTLSAPAGMALAEEAAGASSAVSAQASSESAAVSGAAGETAEAPSETADDNGQSAPTSGAQSASSAPAADNGQSGPASSAPAQSTPAASSEPGASASASQPETAQPESVPQPAESETAVPASDAQSASSALSTAWAGQTLTFVDLHWKTAPLTGVEAVFTGDGDAPAATVAMTAGERGLFTAAVPQGDYCRVAFYRAGEAGTGAPLGGVWRLDGQPETAGGVDASDAVAFAAGAMSAFYYDSGENPATGAPCRITTRPRSLRCTPPAGRPKGRPRPATSCIL